MMQRGPTAETTDRPAVRDLSVPNPDEDVAHLSRELASVRARLQSAEFALAHLGPADQPLEIRLVNMVAAAQAQAQALRDEGRQQVEALVAEAEQLRAFARQAVEDGARQGREEVMKRAEEMLEDANSLRLAAEKTAAELMRAAYAKHAEAEVRAADLLRSTELAHAEVTRQRFEIEQQFLAARAQAQAFLLSSTLEAEARSRDLTDLARQQLADAQHQAETIIGNAEQEARHRLESAANSPSSRSDSHGDAEALTRPAASEADQASNKPEVLGRKAMFGRPQS